MILWRRTIGIGLGLVAASSLWTAAQAYPTQEEGLDAPILAQVDDAPVDEPIDSLTPPKPLAESLPESVAEVEALAMPTASEDLTETLAAEAPLPEVTPVPTAVLENLSQEQVDAIAAIILTAETSASPDVVVNLPTEVLTRLNALPSVNQQVGRRRWLPTSLVRRLRLPQMIASLVRQPRNTALGMLGNHIVVVNPVTGAVLGAVLSGL